MKPARKGPIPIARCADLTSTQRAMVLALRCESRRPTVRLTHWQLTGLLAGSGLLGLVAGVFLQS